MTRTHVYPSVLIKPIDGLPIDYTARKVEFCGIGLMTEL